LHLGNKIRNLLVKIRKKSCPTTYYEWSLLNIAFSAIFCKSVYAYRPTRIVFVRGWIVLLLRFLCHFHDRLAFRGHPLQQTYLLAWETLVFCFYRPTATGVIICRKKRLFKIHWTFPMWMWQAPTSLWSIEGSRNKQNPSVSTDAVKLPVVQLV